MSAKYVVGVVTGTYNRLASLVRFVDSVRSNILRGLPYIITVVDGGSTDGTLDYCRAQKDIQLIEHGELRGAIRAFCDGARACDAEYVIMANDDILFRPNGILRAVAYLETHPHCAQVCFADNRYSSVHGDGTQYRVEGMMATFPDGEQRMVYYGQVAMVRKALGEQAGWWGDHDTVMSAARTYAGDNYLSACLYEMGYSCDAVTGCEIQDFIENDELRTQNADTGSKDSKLFYARFPTGPQIPAEGRNYPVSDRLRILHLPIYEQAHPQQTNPEAGLTEALAEVGLAIEVDWVNADTDWVEVVKAWQPDLLLTQIQGPGDKITPYRLASARAAMPNTTVVNWNGDVHPRGLTSPEVLDLLRYVDIQTTVNAKVLADYERMGIRAAYWQIGYKDPVDPLPAMPHYDILWQGNCYDQRRNNMLATLRYVAYAEHVALGVYGNCNGAVGNSHYSFSMQRALYQSAAITVGDTYPGGYAYVSNRVFQALSSGAFLLQEQSDGLQEYTGLTAGVHYVAWQNIDDLSQLIRLWLRPEKAKERADIAAQGRAFVREHFSMAAQVRKLFQDILPLMER